MLNPYEVIFQELQEIKEALQKNNTPQTGPAEIIDRTELQKRLGISEPTLINYVKKGKIPQIKIGANCRYNWQKVVAALDRK